MVGGIYIIVLLGTVPYTSSAPGPNANALDEININIGLDEQFPTPTNFSSDYSNNGNNNGYRYKHIGKYNRYGAKNYGHGYGNYEYSRYGAKDLNNLSRDEKQIREDYFFGFCFFFCPTVPAVPQAVHGVWGRWSNWSHCSKSCGRGRKQRTRMCNSPRPSNGGRQCSGNTISTEQCNTQACDLTTFWIKGRNVNCWDSCGKKGGLCITVCGPRGYCCRKGWNDCPKEAQKLAFSNYHSCVIKSAVVGPWGNWSSWSACSQTQKSCGGGRKQRKRICNSQRPNGGRRCRGKSTDNKLCNIKECRIHHSKSNPYDARVTHIDLNLEIDFQNKVVFGFVLLQLQNLKRGNQVIFLDCEHLNISEVRDAKSNTILQNFIFSNRLIIFMPKLEISYQVKITYSTTNKTRRALQWLRERETLGKRKPFLFSTCQATNCRTMLPCQDTPLVKFTYNANITVPREITPVMSAIKKSEIEDGNDGKRIYFFEQKIPIPSSLIGIAAGDLENKTIGPRSIVWAEPEILETAAESFKDVEKWLKAAENIFGPYEWEKLDILVVPKYPVLGIEHPNTMFVSTDVAIFEIGTVIHEMIHSWAGNLVTNLDWGHMWLSEGIQQFFLLKIKAMFNIQNKTIEQLGAKDMRSMKSKIKKLEAQEESNYSKLVMNFTEFYSNPVYKTPSSAFPQIAYKKGSSLMWYLEDIVGKQSMERFIKSYFLTFKKQSIDSRMFENHFKSVFNNSNNANVSKIEWGKWFYSPGNPPHIKEFNGTQDPQVKELDDVWPAKDDEINDIASLWKKLSFTQQRVVVNRWNGSKADWYGDEGETTQLDKLDELCNISSSPSESIKTLWARIGLQFRISVAEDSGEDEEEDKETKYALKIIEEIGDRNLLSSLYVTLYKKDANLAEETFKKHEVTMQDITKWKIMNALDTAKTKD